jgi:hypothetical protein
LNNPPALAEREGPESQGAISTKVAKPLAIVLDAEMGLKGAT